jgi:hypothetical protein
MTRWFSLWFLGVAVLWGCALNRAEGAVLYQIHTFNTLPQGENFPGGHQYEASIVNISTVAGLTGTTAVQLGQLQTINPMASTGAGTPRFQNRPGMDSAQTYGTLIGSQDTPGGYLQFGVSADSGWMDLQSLTFGVIRATASGGSDRKYTVQISVNGGAYSPIATEVAVSAYRQNGVTEVTLDLTGAAYQNVSSVDFRILATGGALEYTGFAINGAHQVPEPMVGALLLLGVTSVGLRRRRSPSLKA